MFKTVFITPVHYNCRTSSRCPARGVRRSNSKIATCSWDTPRIISCSFFSKYIVTLLEHSPFGRLYNDVVNVVFIFIFKKNKYFTSFKIKVHLAVSFHWLKVAKSYFFLCKTSKRSKNTHTEGRRNRFQ